MLMGLLQPVTWVRHGSVRFESAGLVVYVDPWRVEGEPHDADLVVVTHAHGDHYAPADIRKVMDEDTLFCAGADVAALLRQELSLPAERVVEMAVGDAFEGPDGVTVEAVIAENKNHPAGTGFGVVLGLARQRYYLSGDTDTLDKDAACDVLFCVCDGKYNMPDYLDRAPAQITAMKQRPKLVVPYHYDNGPQPGNGQKLAEALNSLGIEAMVLE